MDSIAVDVRPPGARGIDKSLDRSRMRAWRKRRHFSSRLRRFVPKSVACGVRPGGPTASASGVRKPICSMWYRMQTSNFSELIERVRGGDAAAVEQFLGQYQDAVRREIRFLLLDTRLRQIVSESDVCQSVMMRFLVGLWSGKFEIQRSEELAGLLKKIVRARVADLARHWTAQRRDVRRNVSSDHACSVESMTTKASPSQLVANAELLEEIKHRLGDRAQRILALRQQKKTWAEIAGELGESSGPEAIRKQYERALIRVAEQLGMEDLQ